MISAGDRPSTVYERCGFTDYTTFYRNYTAFFGRSPKNAAPTLASRKGAKHGDRLWRVCEIHHS